MKLDTSDEPQEDEDESDSDIRDILGTSVSIGNHAFSQMEADVDKQRRERRLDNQLNADAEQRRLQ